MHWKNNFRLNLVDNGFSLFSIERKPSTDWNSQDIHSIYFFELFFIKLSSKISQMTKPDSLAFKNENSVESFFSSFFFVMVGIHAFYGNAFYGVLTRQIQNRGFSSQGLRVVMVEVIMAHRDDIGPSLWRATAHFLFLRIGENHPLLPQPTPLGLGRNLETRVSLPF